MTVSVLLALLVALASPFPAAPTAPACACAWEKACRPSIEVHFYKKSELGGVAFAKYSLVARNQQGDAHGSFARLRIGPRDLTKAERLRQNGGDARVLRAGDELVMFAINHATGYAGMKTVVVPEYQEGASEIPEIAGDIRLFPPEIEVTVERQLTANGVPAATSPSRIREGGAATRQDQFLKVSTRWRVRLAAAGSDQADAGIADAGQLLTEPADAGSGLRALVDEGTAGAPLERACGDLDDAATARERLDCLNDETTLTDVPAGIPPLAGRIVKLSGEASTDALFQIRGGPLSQQLSVARVVSGNARVLPIENGLHLIHVVGRPLRHADRDGDGVLSGTEAALGSAVIATSDAPLQPGAPDFRDGTQHGFPANAITIKAVYDARLRPEEGGQIRKVPSFDTTREHRFRVMSIDNPVVTAGDGRSTTRPMPDNGTAKADGNDRLYQLELLLNDLGASERASARDNYEVRLGSDANGVECTFVVSLENVLTADCDSEYLPSILSAHDIVYLELFDETNSDNVLFRYNFYGLSNRVDHVSATTTTTLDRAVNVDTASGTYERLARAPHSHLNEAVFAISREIFVGASAAAELRSSDGTFVRRMNLRRESDGLHIDTPPTDPWAAPITMLSDAHSDVVYASMPLPASLVSMQGREAAPRMELVIREGGRPEVVIALGRPEGRIESRAPRAPGHREVQGVDVVDGRLSFSDVDIDVPERAGRVQFIRTYNNQNNEITPLGIGFSHNHDGFLVEEQRSGTTGRYSVVIGGQQLTFPRCTHGVACVSDKSLDASLVVTTTADGIQGVLTDHGSGRVMTFARAGFRGVKTDATKSLLSKVNDGLPGDIVYSYIAGGNALDSVGRDGGLFQLVFSYEEINIFNPAVHTSVKEAVELFGLKRLTGVAVKRGETTIDSVTFSHDLGGSCGPPALRTVHAELLVNRLVATCRSFGFSTQQWHYTYEATPAAGTPTDRLLVSNEIKRREQHLGGLFNAWDYVRAPQGTIPAQSRAAEVVASVLPPGVDSPWTIAWTSTNERTVKRPDGVEHLLKLNRYGSVVKEKILTRTYSSRFANDGEGSTLAESERVLALSVGASDGATTSLGYEPERHRPTDTTFTPGSTSPLAPKGGAGGLTVQTLNYDGRYPIPTTTTFPGADGQQATANISVSSFGSVSSLSIAGGVSPVGFSMNHDPNTGLPTIGTGADGLAVDFSGEDPVFGQRTQQVTTHPSPSGGLGTLTRHFEYDGLGRLNRVREDETGRDEQWTYDVVGRQRTHFKEGGVADVSENTEITSANGITTTDVSIGGQHRLKLVTDAHQRLLRRETDLDAGQTEEETFFYVANHLDHVTTSSRGVTRTLTYNARKELLTDTEAGGTKTRSTTYTRDDDGNVLTVTTKDPLGRTVVTTLDKLGRPARVDYGRSDGHNEPARDVVETTFDVQGNPVSETFGAHTTTMTYDVVGRLLERRAGALDVHDNYTAYDRAGRLLSRTNSPGELSEVYEYKDVLGRLTKKTRTIKTVDQAGAIATMHLTETRTYVDSPTSRTVTIVEEAETGGEGTVPRLKTTVMTVDALDRVVSVQETLPNGSFHTRRTEYTANGLTQTNTDEASSLVTTLTFDRQGSLVKSSTSEQEIVQTVDVAGVVRDRVTTGPHAGQNQVAWHETFDAFGLPIERTLQASGTQAAMTTSWEYPGDGAANETPPGGAALIKTTTNGRGLVLRVEQGPVTTEMAYDGPWLASQKRTEGDSVVSVTTTYDDAGRALTTTETSSKNGAQQYAYTTGTTWAGRTGTVTDSWTVPTLAAISRSATVVQDSLGSVVVRVQDGVRELAVTDAAGRPLFSGASNTALTMTTVVQGLMTSTARGSEVTSVTYDNAGRPEIVTDPLGYSTTTTWSPLGIPTSRTTVAAATTVETFNAAGHVASRTVGGSPGGSTWTYETGAMGELLRVTQPAGGTYVYGYDADRKLTSLTPPEGVQQTWSYADPLRRLRNRTRGTASWGTTWDANGVSTTTSPVGHTTTTVFDGRGRAASTTYSGADGLTSVAASYDPMGQPLLVSEVGTDTGTSAVKTTYGYDGRSRLTSIARDGQPTVGQTYTDGAGVMSATRTLGGQVLSYDGLGRLSSITGGPGGKTMAIGYRPDGLLQSITAPGFSETRGYDGQKRLASIALTADATTTTTTYGYDSRGNRLSETVDGTEVTSYAYDAADRLTGVRYPDGAAELYKLRGDGARLERKHFANYPIAFEAFDAEVATATLMGHDRWDFDARNDGLNSITNLLTSSTAPITTDLAGRVLAQGTRINVWDAADRLRSTEDAGVLTTYTYDAQNHRIRSQTPGEDRTYVWGAGGLEAEGPTGGALAIHTSGLGMSLGVGDELFGHDALGSIVMRVPTSGTSTRTAYDVWGAARATTGPPLGATGDRVGFTGHSNEPTGLVYAQQRWLDPTTGRFLSLDPVAGSLSDPLSTQGFTYAHASPTRFTDPDGRCVVWQGGTDFGTDFEGCAKTSLGFTWGGVKAINSMAVGTAALFAGSVSAQASMLTGGRVGSTEMMDAVADGIVGAVSHPLDTASSAANSVASKLIDGVDRGDYFGVGSTLGETTTHTVTAAAGAASVVSKVAATLGSIANIGEMIANSALQGFARGAGEVARGSTAPAAVAASQGVTASRLAGIATTWSEGANGPRQLEMFSESETFSAAGTDSTRFAARGVRALPPPRPTWTGKVINYKKGAMSPIEHIFFRHGPNSSFPKAGRFAEGTRARDVVRMVDEAAAKGEWTWSGGRASIVHDFQRAIGTHLDGSTATRLLVHLNEAGEVMTTFPMR